MCRGAGGQHVIDQGQVQAMHLHPGCKAKGVAQVAFAGFGVQTLLRGGVLGTQQPVRLAGDTQLLAEPVPQHARLVVPTLTQALAGQGDWQQEGRSWLSRIEVIKQRLAKNFG